MTDSLRPKIFASKCLGFAACRWNGVTIPDTFVDKLKKHADFVTACPEVEIGLGVPRDPIRIVLKDGKYYLMQLNTARDVTSEMSGFSEKYLDSLGEVDGFILKDRSPSCGIKDVKVYPGIEPAGVIARTNGFFAEAVVKKFPYFPVETEARLTNYNIREHFLTGIFAFARFRGIKSRLHMGDLVRFHTENKFLLMAYDQEKMHLLGEIVANHEKKQPEEVFRKYEKHFGEALAKGPGHTSNINVLMHSLGHFSKKLSPEEKKFFLNELEEYRREQVPLSVPVSLLRSYIIRFKEEYLLRQSFFRPYPEEFMAVTDSGKGRARR